MRTETPTDAIFVSCDIVGHGETGDHVEQLARVRDLNDCIRRVCGDYFGAGVIWASGDDGGHVAFLDPAQAAVAIQLIEALFAWAHPGQASQATRRVELRLTGHVGPVSVIEGADRRRELVGDGINVCGSLLKFGEPEAVLVTAAFRDLVRGRQSAGDPTALRVKFGPDRRIYLKHSRGAIVTLLSLDGAFESCADTMTRSDRMSLRRALQAGESWSTITPSVCCRSIPRMRTQSMRCRRSPRRNSSSAGAIRAAWRRIPCFRR